MKGYTWETAEQITIPQLRAINRYLDAHPPTHVLVAAYLGYKGGGKRKRATANPNAAALFSGLIANQSTGGRDLLKD